MKLHEQILKEHSKSNCTAILHWIGDSQSRFDELFRIFTGDDSLLAQRAGWPLSYAVCAHPKLIQKHFAKLLKNLRKPGIHNAVKRNTVRLLQDIQIPEKFQGDVMNICFDYIADPVEKAAVKAFSLTVLQNLARQYPEIRAELRTIIEDRWQYETAAFHSRAKKLMKELR